LPAATAIINGIAHWQRPGRVGIHGGQGVSDQHRQLETLASPGTQGAAE